MCVKELFYGTCHEDKPSLRNGVLVMCQMQFRSIKGIASHRTFSE